MFFRCVGGFFWGAFIGFLIGGFGSMLLANVLQASGQTRGVAMDIANPAGMLVIFGLTGYFTIRPILKQQREDKERNERMILEDRRKDKAKAEEMQRIREKQASDAKRQQEKEERSRSDLLIFVHSIARVPQHELPRIEKEKLHRLDELREAKNEEDQEHCAFLGDPGNRGCWDAAMDHHRRVHDGIETETRQIHLELGKLREAMRS